MKKSKCFFFISGITKNLLRGGLILQLLICLCLTNGGWSEALRGKRDRRNVAYWYRKKMQTNKMLSKAFNFALNIDKRSASE